MSFFPSRFQGHPGLSNCQKPTLLYWRLSVLFACYLLDMWNVSGQDVSCTLPLKETTALLIASIPVPFPTSKNATFFSFSFHRSFYHLPDLRVIAPPAEPMPEPSRLSMDSRGSTGSGVTEHDTQPSVRQNRSRWPGHVLYCDCVICDKLNEPYSP